MAFRKRPVPAEKRIPKKGQLTGEIKGLIRIQLDFRTWAFAKNKSDAAKIKKKFDDRKEKMFAEMKSKIYGKPKKKDG